ncbi:MAG TPA: ParB N-terminal domain-containing protein [bacterium]|nr:ParB N-terminal domain-containing protein [bacterium]
MHAIQGVPIDDILPGDTTYHYHFWNYERDILLRSIREHGIHTPLLLEQTGSGFRIIHGFRRFACAREQHIQNLPGIISSQSEIQNLRSSLIDNRIQAPFNLYEQSQAIHRAHELGATTTEVIQDILPLIGLHSHKNVYDQYTGFRRLPEPLIEFFVEKDIAISRTMVFQQLDSEGLDITLDLLETFSPGINLLEELMTNLYEIGRREERPVGQIYQELQVPEILERTPRPHLALGEIRQQLHAYRYPVLAETHRKIQQLADSLELGSQANIRWDKRLETRGVNVTFHWEQVENIKETSRLLSDEENLTLFRKIFEKI